MNKTNETKYVKGLKIDPKIFVFNFGCECNGECCHYGVYTDLKEAEMIIGLQDRIIPLFDETQSKNISDWFEAPEADSDFASGTAVGTNIVNNKCSFLDKDGLCTLQKLAVQEGKHKWEYKPQYCILFPLTIYENTLTIDDEHIDRLRTCNKQSAASNSIYEACKEELFHFFGPEDFKELETYKEEYLALIQTGVEANGK